MIKYTLTALLSLLTTISYSQDKPDGTEDRVFWLETLSKLSDPILSNLSSGTLKSNMPYESLSASHNGQSYLEAAGRLYCGISPWLELGGDETAEGQLRTRYIDMAVKGLKNIVNPSSPDYLDFDKTSQALVDAAFLAEALLRAPTQLWQKLDEQSQKRMITELKRTRNIKPFNNNWLLFSSMIEAALLEFDGECDSTRLLYGINKFRFEWYKGDSFYGDGESFHMDYYNSFVIHPMLTDILLIMNKHKIPGADFLDIQLKRHARYAEILERMISPEGSYPVVGRSIAYRFGVFHALSQAALMHILPKSIDPAQVRCALTSVMKRQLSSPENFDTNGWLRVGLAGRQINISEGYINTGSLYLCSVVLLPLGLPSDDTFWTSAYTEWTNLKAWNGKDVTADHAIN